MTMRSTTERRVACFGVAWVRDHGQHLEYPAIESIGLDEKWPTATNGRKKEG
jgi:hypothetical protein